MGHQSAAKRQEREPAFHRNEPERSREYGPRSSWHFAIRDNLRKRRTSRRCGLSIAPKPQLGNNRPRRLWHFLRLGLRLARGSLKLLSIYSHESHNGVSVPFWCGWGM